MSSGTIIINFSVIIIGITMFSVYFFRVLRKTKKIFCHESLFERSNSFLILANISNYIETFFNLLLGMLIILHDSSEDYWIPSFILVSFFTRIYAFSIGLRVARIAALYHSRKSGMIIKKSFLFNWKLSFCFTCLYGLLTTVFYFIINSIMGTETASMYIIRIIYAAESFILLLASYIVFTKARHPSISLEYVFYSLIWTTGLVPGGFTRILFTIPIRNALLLLISKESLQIHNQLIRPQLPFLIELENLFEIKELYENFKKFVENFGNPQEKLAFKLYFRIRVNQIQNTQKIIENIIEDYIKNKEFAGLHNSLVLIDIETVEETLKLILTEISSSYLSSNELSDLKRNYFINFN